MNIKRTTNIMWTVFFLSVLLYHGLLTWRLPTVEAPPPELLAHALLAFGAATLVGLIVYDLAVFGRPRTVSVRPEMLPPEGSPIDESTFVRGLKSRYYFTRIMIVLSVAEASGICGLALGLLGGKLWAVHTLFALSYTAMLYIRLRMSTAWERMYLG